MPATPDDIERVAQALHSDDYPLGEWDHVNLEHRVKWRAMARTICSVSMWGDYLDAAKRLAHWDDVDNKRPFTPFADKTERERALWLRRAEVGFAALRQETLEPRARRAPLSFAAGPGDDDGA